jgi:alpha-tubulin suppressor-like RCC1 family protein
MDGYGQLGDGQYVYQKIPVNVSTLGANVVDVHADGYNTCARKNDGTLWCWGYNSNGQLGDGTKGGESCNLNQFCQSLPIQVVQLSNKSAGVSLSSIHVCAFENTGWLWCWGYNMDGQLGLGYKNASVLSPALVGATGSNVIEVAAGSNHTCARKTDGTVWCWGYGHNGELGDGHSNLQDPIPTQVVNLDTNAVQISAGGSHSCAVKNDGTAWCWGRNAYGEIGDGTDINRGVPTQITSLGNSVSEISAGFYHTCARKTDGTVWCWGWNVSGQLGDGTTTNKNLPVQVTLLGSDAAQLSLGGNYEYGQSCALKTNGTVWCWGNNIYGQLGNGQTALVVSSPVQANTLNCQ